MAVTAAIVAGVGLAASVGTTAYSLAQGTPNLPEVKPPPPPPPPPKPPPPPPTPPTETDAGAGIADERRRRAQRFSVADTLLSSPLGSSGRDAPQTKSLLGG